MTLTATVVPGCVEVLGLDDYESAAEQLCRCDQQLPVLVGECTRVLSDRLANASEPTRQQWLAYFADHCAHSCEQAYACYARKPTCVQSGLECASAEECCDWSAGGLVRCENDQCRP